MQCHFMHFDEMFDNRKVGGGQMMAHTERVASFLRGETYKQCCVQIWFNSMHILYVKNKIQWSFHTF